MHWSSFWRISTASSSTGPARQKELAEAIERVGHGQPLDQLTLGQKTGVFRVSGARKDLAKLLDTSLTYFSIQNLEPLRLLRNRVVHEAYQPDEAEAAFAVNQVAVILQETGRLSVQAVPTGAALDPWWHTVTPHRDIREQRLDLKVFAVDLAQVIEGGAVAEYEDARTFSRPASRRSTPRITPEGLALHTLRGEIAYRLGGPDRGPELYEIVRRLFETSPARWRPRPAPPPRPTGTTTASTRTTSPRRPKRRSTAT